MKYLVFLFSVLLFASCASNKKPTRVITSRPSTSTKTPKTNTPKVDTAQWTVLSPEKHPPIRSTVVTDINPILKPIKNVALLMPFEATNDTESLSRGEEKFAHFYGGALLALERLESIERPIDVSVYDTRRSKNKVDQILRNPEIRGADVIVGPYETENLKRISEWGKNNNTPILSPWRSSSNITESNQYYYQLRPLIEQYFEAMLKDALNKYSPANIYVIKRDGQIDRAKVRVFQRLNALLNRNQNVESINEYEVVTDSLSNSDFMVFDSLFIKSPRAAVILPSYSSKDSRFVYSVIRKLNAEMADQQIEIYGMPTLINEERLDLEFFRSLNIKTVDFKHINKSDPNVKKFISDYFEKFGQLPKEDSFHGYDTMIMLSNLSQQSKSISSETFDPIPLFSFGSSFKSYHKDRLSGKSPVIGKPGDFMVNHELKLIEFRNSRFQASPIH